MHNINYSHFNNNKNNYLKIKYNLIKKMNKRLSHNNLVTHFKMNEIKIWVISIRISLNPSHLIITINEFKIIIKITIIILHILILN